LAQALPSGRVGHIQIADAPDRHEPGSGAIDWPPVFALIEKLSAPGATNRWEGWVGCEYLPADSSPGGTSRGLQWLRALRSAGA
jgi:hydroxypyruvate isomerase